MKRAVRHKLPAQQNRLNRPDHALIVELKSQTFSNNRRLTAYGSTSTK